MYEKAMVSERGDTEKHLRRRNGMREKGRRTNLIEFRPAILGGFEKKFSLERKKWFAGGLRTSS